MLNLSLVRALLLVPFLSTCGLACRGPLHWQAGHLCPYDALARLLPTATLHSLPERSISPLPAAGASTRSSSTHDPTSSSTSSSVDSDNSSSVALQDLNTIHNRRLPFIVAGAGSPSGISLWLVSLRSNGQWPSSQIDYTSGCNAQRANWPAQSHWNRILTMSAAFHGGLAGADQWVGSTELRQAISLAMDFWFSDDFTNDACLDHGGLSSCPCGTPGFWNTNWFSNIDGIPTLVGQSCLLLNDTLTSTQLSNCTNFSGRSYATFLRPIHGVQGGRLTGANTLDVASIGIDLALLTSNISLLQDAYQRVHREVVVQPAVRADGIRPDGSFGQHDGIIYNGNYGKDYTNDVLALELEAADTRFQATNDSKDAFATLLNGDQWMIYKNVKKGTLHWDFSVLGRFISFPVADNQATASIKVNLTQVRLLGEEWKSQTIKEVYNDLTKKGSNANVGNLHGNRAFYNNDYVVQRGPGYVTTLRMYSNRTQNTECTNSQNPFGFHLSDGTLYTYLTGDEYEDVAAAWDWNLIPGTTVDYNGTPLTCGTTDAKGVEAFVGAASMGDVGLAAMRYRNPVTGALEWQKAWVFLHGNLQHVMVNNITQQWLGNDIEQTPHVYSVLDQRKRVGDIWVDDTPISNGGNFTAARSLWHAGVGYMFPGSGLTNPLSNSSVKLSVDFGNRTGNWSAIGISKQPPPSIDLMSAWLVHSSEHPQSVTSGTPTTNLAPISYTIFPGTSTYFDFAHKSKNSMGGLVEIRNDEHVSALCDVRRHQKEFRRDSEHAKRSIVRSAYIVFWDSHGGEVELPSTRSSHNMNMKRRRGEDITIFSDVGLVIIFEERKSGNYRITVADPTQSTSIATVTVKIGDIQTRQVMFDLPRGELAGSSISQSFRV